MWATAIVMTDRASITSIRRVALLARGACVTFDVETQLLEPDLACESAQVSNRVIPERFARYREAPNPSLD